MLAPLNSPLIGRVSKPAPSPMPNPFAEITGHAGLVATEFSYRKDEEIYGEDEPAEYVYQVMSGAVRSYKLMSDGRRQIGAFHLPGDVFGLEYGSMHRLDVQGPGLRPDTRMVSYDKDLNVIVALAAAEPPAADPAPGGSASASGAPLAPIDGGKRLPGDTRSKTPKQTREIDEKDPYKK